jgi:hypothetical protein
LTVKTSDAILLELLERLADATELVEVNIAAGIALNELLGIDTDWGSDRHQPTGEARASAPGLLFAGSAF